MNLYAIFDIYGTVANPPRRMRSRQGGDLPADEFDLKIDPQKEGADTMVYKIECWNTARNYVKGLQAGTRVMVRGRLVGRRYQDKNGNWRSEHKLMANTLWVAHGGSVHREQRPQELSYTHETERQRAAARSYAETHDGEQDLAEEDCPF